MPEYFELSSQKPRKKIFATTGIEKIARGVSTHIY